MSIVAVTRAEPIAVPAATIAVVTAAAAAITASKAATAISPATSAASPKASIASPESSALSPVSSRSSPASPAPSWRSSSCILVEAISAWSSAICEDESCASSGRSLRASDWTCCKISSFSAVRAVFSASTASLAASKSTFLGSNSRAFSRFFKAASSFFICDSTLCRDLTSPDVLPSIWMVMPLIAPAIYIPHLIDGKRHLYQIEWP